mgnify:CR=1 FL=1
MTFKLRIPGRDDFETQSAANHANPLIQTQPTSRLAELAANEECISPACTPPISRLAGLAGIAESIEARQIAADLVRAAMRVCDRHGDDERQYDVHIQLHRHLPQASASADCYASLVGCSTSSLKTRKPSSGRRP